MGNGFVYIDVQRGRQRGNVYPIQSGRMPTGRWLCRWIRQG